MAVCACGFLTARIPERRRFPTPTRPTPRRCWRSLKAASKAWANASATTMTTDLNLFKLLSLTTTVTKSYDIQPRREDSSLVIAIFTFGKVTTRSPAWQLNFNLTVEGKLVRNILEIDLIFHLVNSLLLPTKLAGITPRPLNV